MAHVTKCEIDGVVLRGCQVIGGETRLLLIREQGIICYGHRAGQCISLAPGKQDDYRLLERVPGTSIQSDGPLHGYEAAIEILKSISDCRRIAHIHPEVSTILSDAEATALRTIQPRIALVSQTERIDDIGPLQATATNPAH